LYIPDVDRVVERAVAAGAKILKPVQDQFYGDRSAFIQDPFGHLWGVATHVEDVAPQEFEERAKKAKQAA
jgi:PhnB protein